MYQACEISAFMGKSAFLFNNWNSDFGVFLKIHKEVCVFQCIRSAGFIFLKGFFFFLSENNGLFYDLEAVTGCRNHMLNDIWGLWAETAISSPETVAKRSSLPEFALLIAEEPNTAILFYVIQRKGWKWKLSFVTMFNPFHPRVITHDFGIKPYHNTTA